MLYLFKSICFIKKAQLTELLRADDRNRTYVSTLVMWSNDHYTTSAFELDQRPFANRDLVVNFRQSVPRHFLIKQDGLFVRALPTELLIPKNQVGFEPTTMLA